jgi:hypothetical protein
MPARVAVIRLEERDIQDLEQAVLDRDPAAALDFASRVLWPKVEVVLRRSPCKPAFEWGTGGPPTGPAGPL